MNCIIVDDEAPARALIREHVKKVPTLNLMGEFKNPLETLSFVQTNHVDLIFLDIQMPGLTGLDFIKTLQKKPKIILTTAYAEYALEGYELDVVDYLLKPISFERFLKAVNKVSANPSPSVFAQQEPTSQTAPTIQVKSDGETHIIKLEDIKYIQGLREYVTYHLTSKKLIVLESLSKIEEKLPTSRFIRVHKSFIVGRSFISSYSGHEVKVGDVAIPVGKSYKEATLKELK